jgi:hypothetical protein
VNWILGIADKQDQENNKKCRAREVPKSTREPVYETMVQREDERRRQKQQRREDWGMFKQGLSEQEKLEMGINEKEREKEGALRPKDPVPDFRARKVPSTNRLGLYEELVDGPMMNREARKYQVENDMKVSKANAVGSDNLWAVSGKAADQVRQAKYYFYF